MANIPISPSIATQPPTASPATPAPSKSDSGNLFQQLIQQTNQDQQFSEQAIQDFIQQKPGTSVQQVVLAVAQAEMSFQFFMEIRNQLVDSYNELMRMQF